MKAITLDAVYTRCDEVGECMLWTGSMNHGRNPQVWCCGRLTSIRRELFKLAHGFELPPDMMASPKCEDVRCVRVEHIVARTMRQVIAVAVKAGKFKSPQRLAAVTAGIRKSSRVVIDLETAREIRASDEANFEIARRLKITESIVSRVRLGRSWLEGARGTSVFNL